MGSPVVLWLALIIFQGQAYRERCSLAQLALKGNGAIMQGYFQGLARVKPSNVASSQTKQPTVHLGNFHRPIFW
jgi:hypothetical protein